MSVTFPYFYMTPYTGSLYSAEQLAQISSKNDGWTMELFWLPATRQVLFNIPEGLQIKAGLYVQPDGAITHSLAHCLGVPQQFIVVHNFAVFNYGKVEFCTDAMRLGFYDCAWSDYTCDGLALQFDVEVDRSCITSSHRIIKVVREIIAEEDRAAEKEQEQEQQKQKQKQAQQQKQKQKQAQHTDDDEDAYADMPALISLEDNEDEYADMPALISLEDDEYADMPALIPI